MGISVLYFYSITFQRQVLLLLLHSVKYVYNRHNISVLLERDGQTVVTSYGTACANNGVMHILTKNRLVLSSLLGLKYAICGYCEGFNLFASRKNNPLTSGFCLQLRLQSAFTPGTSNSVVNVYIDSKGDMTP